MVEIRVQLLEENNFNNGKLFKLCQGWKLRLQHANSIVHRKVRVYCNLPPLAAQAKFVRTKYYELEWCQLTSIRHDDFNKYIDIECHMPGSFNYYFTYEDTSNSAQMGGSNFLIEPELKLSNGHRVDLNSLQIHTVLSKLMGPLNEWKTRLQVSHECNYNMIHFTPVQDLCDESRSGYCISDHLSLLKRTSVDGKFGFDDLNVLIETIYREWNMFSICDLGKCLF
jgi:glycogen debranching enzyme